MVSRTASVARTYPPAPPGPVALVLGPRVGWAGEPQLHDEELEPWLGRQDGVHKQRTQRQDSYATINVHRSELSDLQSGRVNAARVPLLSARGYTGTQRMRCHPAHYTSTKQRDRGAPQTVKQAQDHCC